MCSGRFVNIDASARLPTQQHGVSSDYQTALATNSGVIYLMTDFQVLHHHLLYAVICVFYIIGMWVNENEPYHMVMLLYVSVYYTMYVRAGLLISFLST